MRVPVYQPQAGAPSLRRLPRENPEAAAAPYRAMADLARTVARIGVAEVERATRIRNETWLTETLSTARARAYAEYDEAKRAAPEGAPNFRAERAQAVESLAEALLKDAPDEETALALRQGLAALRFDIERDATAFESAAAAAAARSRYERARDTDANLLLSHPEQYETVRRQREAARAALAGVLPADAVAALAAEDESLLAGAMVSGLIDQDPAAALRLLDGGQLDARLAPEQKGRLMGAAQREIDRRRAEAEARAAVARAEYRQAVADYAAYVAAGNPASDPRYSREEIIRALGAEDGEAVWRQVQQAEAIGQAAAEVALASPEEIAERLSALQADLAAGPDQYRARAEVVEAYVTAVNRRQNALAADPGGYVMRSPGVAEAAREMAEAGNDPEAQAQASRRWLHAAIAEQRRLGVPASEVALPKAMAAEIVQSVMEAQGQERADALVVQQQRFGPRLWPVVMRSLEAAGLPAPGRVLAALDRPDQARVRTEIAALWETPTEDLKRRIGRDGAVAIDDELDDLMVEFGEALGPGSESIYRDWQDQARRVAYARAQHDSPQRAARSVVEDMIDRAYRVEELRGRYVMIPRTVDFDVVADGAEEILGRLDLLGPLEIASRDPDLPPNLQLDLYRDSLRRHAYWVTAGDESGLVLMEPGDVTVHYADGRPVVLSWEQLEQAAAGIMPQPARIDR